MATAAERSMVAKIAAHSRWANEADPAAATVKARRAFMARFEQQVDPESLLPVDERARRAEHAMRAYMTGLALRREQARREGRTRSKTPGARAPRTARRDGEGASTQHAAAS